MATTIRDTLSAILGVRLPANSAHWDRLFKELDTNGMVTRKKHLEIIVALAKYIDAIEHIK